MFAYLPARPPRSRPPRGRRGSATVEFALLAPLLVVLILWSNYFWEVSRVRIKAAEAARFVAFERTVRKDLGAITAEAQSRYQDLNGADQGVALGSGFRNGLTLSITAKDDKAPIVTNPNDDDGSLDYAAGRGVIDFKTAGEAIVLVGNKVAPIIDDLGLNLSQAAVEATVDVQMKNRIIPENIAWFVTGFSGNTLNVSFKEKFFLYHDTWRAWEPGDNPKNNQAIVDRRVRERVSKIAYRGLKDKGAEALALFGAATSILQLEYPFNSDFVDKAILVRKVKDDGYYPTKTPTGSRPTRTMPGDVLQAAYWQSDDKACFNNCEPNDVQYKRGLLSGKGRGDNWPMRAYQCRGPFFQGAAKSEEPESSYSLGLVDGREYFNYGNDACAEDPNAGNY